MKEKEILFDPNDKVSFAEGVFPAHIVEITRRSSVKYEGTYTYRVKVKIDKEAAKVNVPLFEYKDGNRTPSLNDLGEQITGPADFMVGKEFSSNRDIWYHEPDKLKHGESWKNRTYKEFLDALGLTKEVTKDKKKMIKMVEIEDNDKDILGMPILVDLKFHTFKSNRDGRDVTILGVANYLKWDGGERIEIENTDDDSKEVPF